MKLSALTGETFAGDPDIAGITADSRAVKSGFLFAALPGQKLDGRDFIDDAVSKGAAAILSNRHVDAAVPVIIADEPRLRLAEVAGRFFPKQPAFIAGVTGTNGKTSTATFAAELWNRLGETAGSIGTLGAKSSVYSRTLQHTTPDPVTLHETLDAMARAEVTRLCMEVSSHALVQHRADAVTFSAAAFTNITQDHFDYHAGFDDYRAAKARLFTELLPADGFAVVNADGEGADDMIGRCVAGGRRVLTTGARGRDLTLTKAVPHAAGLSVSVAYGAKAVDLELPLIGAFQAENALLAAMIVAQSGFGLDATLSLLPLLAGVPGRMQRVADSNDGAAVYVDYAHTPNAIATALAAIRPHAKNRLIIVIGAGGDRDSAKRPHMGRAAALGADAVIVTDDNPRSEDPSDIRRQVLSGAPKALEIGDRGEAIAKGVSMLGAGDILLVAGKGHETGQIIKGETFPFDDAEAARAAMQNRAGGGT